MCKPPPTVQRVMDIGGTILNPVGYLGTKAAMAASQGGIPAAKQDVLNTANSIAGNTPPGDDMPGAASGSDSGAPPGPSPAPTESAAILAKRRLAQMRMGLLSTMTTGGAGITTAPMLFQPTAVAGGGKTQLGL